MSNKTHYFKTFPLFLIGMFLRINLYNLVIKNIKMSLVRIQFAINIYPYIIYPYHPLIISKIIIYETCNTLAVKELPFTSA